MHDQESKLKFCSYTRVSTGKQRDAMTIENQRISIENYVKYHRDIEIVREYSDDGISAFKDRPKYDMMMNDLDKYDGIIIAKLSRIGRSTRQLLAIVDDLKDKGKELIVVNDNIDTTTPQGRLFFTILAAFNEYEAALIRERMNEGLRRYKENGGRLGRPVIPLVDVSDGSQPTDKKLRFQYEKQGLGLKTLSKIYKVTRNTIRRRLVELGVTIRKPKGV